MKNPLRGYAVVRLPSANFLQTLRGAMTAVFLLSTFPFS